MGNVIKRSDQLLVFQANGDGFGETSDLHAVERLLPEYRRLLDVAYKYTTGQDPNKNRVRAVRYQAAFETGCLDVVVDVSLKASPLLMGVLAADPGGFHFAKSSFLLLSKVLELRKKVRDLLKSQKKLPEFQMNMQHASLADSLVAPILITGDNNVVHVTPPVYLAALASHGAVNRLAKAVDGQVVRDVNLQHDGRMGQCLTSADRGLAEASMGSNQQTVKLQGRLDALSISTHGGYLVIGEARYPVNWDESVKEKMKNILDREAAVFLARPISDFSRLSDAPVRFFIVDCDLGQMSFD